jgi:phosphopantothenoylcysteine decarboxylase / phosphopantothenate---cysteine ligase
MNRLENKRILLGITGSIAAYKSADLARRLKESGAEVQVVMTRAATDFITPLTMQALSGKPVFLNLLDADEEASMGHISLARWADVIAIAPASANFIARLAHGVADDLLSTLCLASKGPIAVAPAMNQLMWANAATQENVTTLKQRGIHIWGPGQGDQACGETGLGRMLEPGQLVELVTGVFQPRTLTGVRVLVSAGPTQEDIDPVRYLSNHSSGKMGFAIARAAAEADATVTLVSGPVTLAAIERVKQISVRSAAQMYEQIQNFAQHNDIFISAAAVADYRPTHIAGQKIKKDAKAINLQLEPTPDILAGVTKLVRPPFVVGFAAETENLEANARIKLKMKALDMIAANRVGRREDNGFTTGFESDENELTVFWQNGSIKLPLATKDRLGRELIAVIAERYYAKNRTQDS